MNDKTKPPGAQKHQLADIIFYYLESNERRRFDDVLSEFDGKTDLESRNALGKTALILAAEHGWTKLARELIALGADVNAASNDGKSVLHWGARHEVTAASILKAGANAMSKDKNGETPLHNAAAYGSSVFLRKLIHAGADVSAVAGTMGTPLHAALHYEQDECAVLLIKAGARNDIKHRGVTPAGLASKMKKKGLADEIRAYEASVKAMQAVEIMMRAHGLMSELSNAQPK